MKGSLKKLATVFGLSLGGKALFNMGVSLKQSEENLRQFSGVNLDNVNNSLDAMQNRLGDIQDGAENIIRRKTLNVLATSFIKEFGSANKEVKLLTELLETASLQKLATGVSIEETFAGLVSGVRTGGLEAFLGLPGFDLERKRAREFALTTIDPGEPGGRIGQEQRKLEVSNILNNLLQELRARAAVVSPELVGVAVGKEIIIEATERAAEVATIAGVKAGLAAIKAVTNTDNILIDKPEAGFSGLANESINRMRERKQARESNIINNVEINSSFTINEATDAKVVASEVRKQNQKMIDDAGNQIIRSEQQ